MTTSPTDPAPDTPGRDTPTSDTTASDTPTSDTPASDTPAFDTTASGTSASHATASHATASQSTASGTIASDTGRHRADDSIDTTGDVFTTADTGPAPRAARAPVSGPAAGWIGVLAAVLLLAAGVIALHDAVIGFGWAEGTSWIVATSDWLDDRVHQTWMTIVAIPVLIIGLILVVLALRGRQQTAVRVTDLTWIPYSDVARVSSTAARTVPGVVDAQSTASPKKLVVRVQALNTDVTGSVREAVTAALDGWAYTPKIDVRTTTRGDGA